jgi:hypothetical protein
VVGSTGFPACEIGCWNVEIGNWQVGQASCLQVGQASCLQVAQASCLQVAQASCLQVAQASCLPDSSACILPVEPDDGKTFKVYYNCLVHSLPKSHDADSHCKKHYQEKGQDQSYEVVDSASL